MNMTKISNHLQDILLSIIKIRKTLHQIPELKYEDVKNVGSNSGTF